MIWRNAKQLVSTFASASLAEASFSIIILDGNLLFFLAHFIFFFSSINNSEWQLNEQTQTCNKFGELAFKEKLAMLKCLLSVELVSYVISINQAQPRPTDFIPRFCKTKIQRKPYSIHVAKQNPSD